MEVIKVINFVRKLKIGSIFKQIPHYRIPIFQKAFESVSGVRKNENALLLSLYTVFLIHFFTFEYYCGKNTVLKKFAAGFYYN